MKKNLILLFLIICMALSFCACGIEYPAVLTIDGENVSLLEFNYYFSTMKLQVEQTISTDEIDMYWQTEKEGKTAFELLKETAYDEMVGLRVTAKKAEEMGISYSDPAVMQATTVFKNQIIQAAESENEYYEMTNTDSETINKIAKMYAMRSAMVELLAQQGVIDFSDQAYKTAFESNWLKANHILINTQNQLTGETLSDEEKAEKKAQAEAILARVKAGEDFNTLVKELSEDPGKETNPEGYVFTSGEMVAEFEDAVVALEPGQISDIVETSFGYHIIKRLPLSAAADSASFEEKKASIESEIIMNYLTENIPSWKEEMTIVENKAPINKIKL